MKVPPIVIEATLPEHYDESDMYVVIKTKPSHKLQARILQENIKAISEEGENNDRERLR